MSEARELVRLVAILSRLDSPYDGERAAAGLLASRALRKMGMTWGELLAALHPAPPAPARPSTAHPLHWRAMVRQCLDESHKLTDWESRFLVAIGRRPRISEKQQDVLAGIVRKLGR